MVANGLQLLTKHVDTDGVLWTSAQLFIHPTMNQDGSDISKAESIMFINVQNRQLEIV